MRIFILLFLLCPFLTVGQTTLIPYLSGDKYGLADETGKILIAPQYDLVAFTVYPGLYAMKQNDLWGFLNTKGEIVFPCTFQVTYPDYLLTGPPIMIIGQPGTDVSSSSIKGRVLIQVQDAGHTMYYFNPYQPNDLGKAYQFNYDASFAIKAEKDFRHTGILKVKLKEGGFNFLDSLGSEIFPEAVKDGKPIGEQVLLIKNAEDKWGVYNLLQRTEPEFLYKNYYVTPNPGIFKLSQHATGMWSYINSKGKIIAEQLYDDVIKVVGDCVLMNGSRNGVIYNIDGTVRAEIPGHSLQPFSDSLIELQSHSTVKYGLANLDGKVLLESRFTDLQPLKNNQIGFSTGHSTGVMDSLLNILWENEQWRIGGSISGTTGYYKISEVKGLYNHFGMADSLGNLVLPFQFIDFHFDKSVGLFQATKKDSISFFTPRGKMIGSYCSDVDQVSELVDGYVISCDGTTLQYDIDGTLKGTYIQPAYPERRIVKSNNSVGQGLAKVLDANGREVFPSTYTDIRSDESGIGNYIVKRNWKEGVVDSIGRELIPSIYHDLNYSRYIWNVYYGTDGESTYVVRPHASPVRIGGLMSGRGRTIVKKIGSFHYFATVVKIYSDRSQSETTFFDLDWSKIRYEKGIEVVDDPGAAFIPKGFALVRDHTSELAFIINLQTGIRYRGE